MPKRRIPDRRRVLGAKVARVDRLSEHFALVTIAGKDLSELVPLGGDQWFRFFFSREGQTDLRLPTATGNSWMAQTLMMPAGARPWVRNYTIRDSRPDLCELDIIIAVHGGAAPGSRFALTTKPGEEVGIFDEGIAYLPCGDAHLLLMADESAVPAALAILDKAPRQSVGLALLEVPSESDILSVSAPAGVDIRWLPRARTERVGQQALRHLREVELPAAPRYAWLAGESALVTTGRRLLTRERGLPKSDIAFLGYWRDGRASLG